MSLHALPGLDSMADLSGFSVHLLEQLIEILSWICFFGLLLVLFCLLLLWAQECRARGGTSEGECSSVLRNSLHQLLRIVPLALVLFAGVALGEQADEAEILFQKALHEEVVKGSLESAMSLYRRVVEVAGEDRALAASALVHIGGCYEKLGREEARRTYEQVVRDYADQAASTEIARERLSALARAAVPSQANLSLKMVWSDPTTDVQGSPSPDGRFLTFVDWTTGDLAIRDLQSGKSRRLTNKGTWQESADFALYSSWSPDGKTIAFDWNSFKNPTDYSGSTEVRLIQPDGHGLRTVLSAGPEGWVGVTGWSPDGKEILVFGFEKGKAYIGTVGVSDGQLSVIRNLRVPPFWPASFSPDGKYILFTERDEAGAADIFVVSRDGKECFPLVSHPAFDRSLGWHPSGSPVLFVSDRSGSLDLWALRVQDGRPAAEPEMISSSVPADNSMGFTQNGDLLLGAFRRTADVYVVETTTDGPTPYTTPTKLLQRFEGVNSWPSYSPDGRWLAYLSSRGVLARMNSRQDTLCLLDLNGGRTREYTLEFEDLYNPLWLPGSNLLILAARLDQNRMALCEFSPDTRQAACLREVTHPDALVSHQVSPDGRTLYYSRANQEQDVSEILRLDRESGLETVLFQGRADDWFKLALSPDGSELAFLNRATERSIRILQVESGVVKEVSRFEQQGNFVIEFAWTADGKHLLVPRSETASPQPPVWDLWRIRVSDGHGEKVLTRTGQPSKITVHPEGRLMAFSSPGAESPNAAVWIVTGYLPVSEKP